MNWLTKKQKNWFQEREIKVGGIYMFPRFGFELYSKPCYSSGQYLDTNPFTKSLDNERLIVKEKIDGFCRINFVSGKKCPDGYIEEYDLKQRDVFEKLILYFLCFIPLVIYNNLKKPEPQNY